MIKTKPPGPFTGKCYCGRELILRKTKPYTATRDGHLYYDYYYCPKCKFNYATEKEIYSEKEINKMISG